MKPAFKYIVAVTLAISAAFAMPTLTSQLAAQPVAQPLIGVAKLTLAQLLPSYSQGAAFGPGIMESTAPGAGPGPWLLFNVPPATAAYLTVQSLGERTARIYANGTLQMEIAGGQCRGVSIGTGSQVSMDFAAGPGEGRIIWVARQP